MPDRKERKHQPPELVVQSLLLHRSAAAASASAPSKEGKAATTDTNHRRGGRRRRRRRLLQVLSLSAFLVSWVANGEILQGISNGLLCPRSVPYDKPAAITWFSYNYMLLGFAVVYPYATRRRNWTMSFYVRCVWAGDLGPTKSILACAGISFALQVLNIFYIVGLGRITVSLSNAIYQLQTVFTVGLSVCLLGDKFVRSEAVGMLVSVVGVALIVLPPLLRGSESNGDDEEKEAPDGPSSDSAGPMMVGTMATLASAAIGGAYLVSWRIFDERRRRRRNPAATTAVNTPLEGFVDTLMTLAAIGLCNLTVGWITLPLLHWLGLEEFRLPPTPSHWWVLNWNGLVEFTFDASCAVAIYMTSPVVVAIASPLTIPLSLAADRALYGSAAAVETATGLSLWMGAALILFGVVLLETKPDVTTYCLRWHQRRKEGAECEIEEEPEHASIALGMLEDEGYMYGGVDPV